MERQNRNLCWCLLLRFQSTLHETKTKALGLVQEEKQRPAASKMESSQEAEGAGVGPPPQGGGLFTRRVGLNQPPTALGFQGGAICAWHPDAPCEQERGTDGWPRHNEKWINVSSHLVLAFSLREAAPQRSQSMGSSFAYWEDGPLRIRGWQPLLS